MGIARRIMAYGIGALALFLVLSCAAIYRNRAYLAQCFSSAASAYGAMLVYVLIFVVAIAYLLRSLMR